MDVAGPTMACHLALIRWRCIVWFDGMVAQVALDALGFCPQAAEASHDAETGR